MFIVYIAVTVVAAAANVFAAALDFVRSQKILGAMARLGVPERLLPLLGIVKAIGAVGLLAGIGAPTIGTAAAVGLVVFFVGAIITHLRAHDYALGQPAVFLLLAVASLVLVVNARGSMALMPMAQ
jgi:hypothetical protein